ncbi:putative phosphatidylethanolamine-binding protein [Diplonema papillatum]|nr:putative phosphatidylethanolamine-binding protein [Diplonema papillatum]
MQRTQPLLKTWQLGRKNQPIKKGQIAGGPGRLRLWAGVGKMLPKIGYSTIHVPKGQSILKKGVVNTSSERDLPEPQHYSKLQWASEDDTPALIHPNSQSLQGFGKDGGDYFDGYHFTAGVFMKEIEQRPAQVISLNIKDLGKVYYPKVPSVDSRTLTNKQWRRQANQNKVRLYLQKHQLFSVFPSASSELNMNVNYSDDTPRKYWQSVYTGNVLELNKLLNAPRVMIASDGISGDDYYTLVMSTPDYPFRTAPEPGHLLHWVVANIKVSPERLDLVPSADTIVPYLMPLPSEDAGLLRYTFALYKQTKKLENPQCLSSAALSERRHFFLHNTTGTEHSVRKAMSPIEEVIGADPTALTFFHTAFDYEVADWYTQNHEREPMWHPTDIVENTTHYQRKERHIEKFTPYGGIEDIKAYRAWNRGHVSFF